MPDYKAILFNPPAPPARIMLRNPEAGTTFSDVRDCNLEGVERHPTNSGVMNYE